MTRIDIQLETYEKFRFCRPWKTFFLVSTYFLYLLFWNLLMKIVKMVVPTTLHYHAVFVLSPLFPTPTRRHFVFVFLPLFFFPIFAPAGTARSRYGRFLECCGKVWDARPSLLTFPCFLNPDVVWFIISELMWPKKLGCSWTWRSKAWTGKNGGAPLTHKELAVWMKRDARKDPPTVSGSEAGETCSLQFV